jgi:protocatechuate 3,4-dioxygenase beta subunit
MTKFAWFLAFPIVLALGQTAPPSTSTETAKKATIEGVVVNETTTEPLRRAEIILHRSGQSGMTMGDNSAYSAVTDASGKFRIESIAPGEYILDHHKTGFLNSRAAFGFSSSSLKLSSGESLTNLRYSLLPQAIVSGRVEDDEKEPVQGASVMLLHSRYMRGSLRMMPSGQAQTNDRGEYRIINVQPGKYYVQANLQGTMLGGGGSSETLATAGVPRTAFVSTYYPSATDVAQSIKIEARAGLELSGQDITLRKEKVVKVSGKVLEADGSPAKQTFIILMMEGGFQPNSNSASVVDEKGNFTVNNVRPGQYTATSNKMHSQTQQVALTTVTVGDADVTNVILQMLPSHDMKGSIVLEGSDKKGFDFARFYINMNPVGSSPFGGAGAQAKSDGTFTISQLSAGHYIPSVYGGGGECYVQSIQVGAEDVYGKEVDAATLAASGLRVVVRLDAAKVSGTVEIPEDRKANLRSPAVVLMPADPHLRNAGQISIDTPNQTNGFELKDLRPGDYLAFAFEEYDSSSLEDPEVFAAIEGKATKVSLTPGQSKELSLKIMPWPEQFADRLQ